ncbi:hypothetical protein Agub_g5481 [Astrephomene gubernaculifera]|uniref:Uncharacterized protein n=1 Tax=Astrephomene gubernaculifera TaxID=47775 RepID=A0AAD3DLY6_9CHLO|nr:hypothetical protein Agub_g5481 [Astrephomene gubernaculifera]
MEAKANGRALPPRPTLLVGEAGDVEACRRAWAQLQPIVVELLRRDSEGCASADELESAVRRFRSLRESLVAAYVQDELAVQVYEASADVCLAAKSWSEYLKSVNGLTTELYPAVQQLQQQQRWQEQSQQHPVSAGYPTGALQAFPQAPEASIASSNSSSDTAGGTKEHGEQPQGQPTPPPQQQQEADERPSVRPAAVVCEGSSAAGGCNGGGGGGRVIHGTCARHDTGEAESSSSEGGAGFGGGSSSTSSSRCSRCSEMYAAHCLFLACVPSGRVADAAAVLRNQHALSYMSSGHMRFANKDHQVLSAMALGDWHAFLRLREAAPCSSLRAILNLRAGQVRTIALRCLSAAYRTLPAAAAAAMLRLPDASGPLYRDDSTSSGLHGHGDGVTLLPACSKENADGRPPSSTAQGASNTPSCQRDEAGGVMGMRGAVKEAALGNVTHGSSIAAVALRVVLAEAAAAGVKGAQLAVEGLSAWAEGGAGEVQELSFR